MLGETTTCVGATGAGLEEIASWAIQGQVKDKFKVYGKLGSSCFCMLWLLCLFFLRCLTKTSEFSFHQPPFSHSLPGRTRWSPNSLIQGTISIAIPVEAWRGHRASSPPPDGSRFAVRWQLRPKRSGRDRMETR